MSSLRLNAEKVEETEALPSIGSSLLGSFFCTLYSVTPEDMNSSLSWNCYMKGEFRKLLAISNILVFFYGDKCL